MFSRAISLIAALVATACTKGDPSDWYGSRLGQPVAAGGRERVRNVQNGVDLPRTAPWDVAVGTTNAEGRIVEMTFSERCCTFMADAPAGYVPKHLKSTGQMAEDMATAKAYALARLGEPTSIHEGAANDSSLTMAWNLALPVKLYPNGQLGPQQVDPANRNPVAAASLNLSPQAILLVIRGRGDAIERLTPPPAPPSR